MADNDNGSGTATTAIVAIFVVIVLAIVLFFGARFFTGSSTKKVDVDINIQKPK